MDGHDTSDAAAERSSTQNAAEGEAGGTAGAPPGGGGRRSWLAPLHVGRARRSGATTAIAQLAQRRRDEWTPPTWTSGAWTVPAAAQERDAAAPSAVDRGLVRPTLWTFGATAAGLLAFDTTRTLVAPDSPLRGSLVVSVLVSGSVAAYVTYRALRARRTLHRQMAAEQAARVRLETEQRVLVARAHELELSHQALSTEIAERRRAEEVARESEARFRAVAEAAHDAIVTVDRRGRIVFWNAAAESMFGHADVEALGQPLALILPHALPGGAAAGGFERVAGNEALVGRTTALEARHKCGMLVPVELSLSRWTVEDEVFFTGLLRDVTERRHAEAALRTSEARYRQLVEQSPEAIVVSRDGRLLFANRAAARLIGVDDAETLVGRLLTEFVLPGDHARLARRVADHAPGAAPAAAPEGADGPGATGAEYRLRGPQDTVIEVEALSVAVEHHGRPAVQTVLRDVTGRRSAERAVRESEARLRAIFAQAAVGMALVDVNAILVDANPALQQFLGYSAAELIGRSLAELMPDDDAATITQLLHEVRAGLRDDVTVEQRYLRRDGRLVWGQLTISRVEAADGDLRYLVGIIQDVTERKRLEEQLTHQAFHDPLTGLANRALFRDRVEHALTRATRGEAVAVLFLDLDDFKTVNDSLGHAAGDRLLTLVAERLLRATRGSDTVARLGGDEFAVLLEGMVEERDALTAVERITTSLRRSILLDGREVSVGVSLGVAPARGGESADELLRNADVAMYRAKERGKGGFAIFEPAMHRAVLERLELEADLRQALGREELHLLYQPIVELADGRVTGVEALLRWRHPLRGLVMPGDFVSVAEETGAILALGRWVLHEACMQLCRWQRELPAGRAPTVSVNLSGRQLQDPALVDDVAAVLTATGVDPQGLVLEITESVIMQRTEETLRRLHALKALGVRLAVDDFGTGYSSLGYLQRFPIDILKIDKAFVDGVAHGGSDAALARTIIALGDMLQLRTVAEGVEHDAQRRELVSLGCRLGQGYLFARPLAPAELDALLRETRGVLPGRALSLAG